MLVPLHGGMAEGLLLLGQEVRDSDHSDHAQSEGPDLERVIAKWVNINQNKQTQKHTKTQAKKKNNYVSANIYFFLCGEQNFTEG